MKLVIKNFWKFNDYANNYFRNHEKQMVECWDEVGGKYFFKFLYKDIEWSVKLGGERDFMRGWPVEVWAADYSLGINLKISETNVRHEVLNDMHSWCRFLDGIIISNYIHYRV